MLYRRGPTHEKVPNQAVKGTQAHLVFVGRKGRTASYSFSLEVETIYSE